MRKYREALKKFIEADIHPHVPEERAVYFRTASFESIEVEYLDVIYSIVRATKSSAILETGTHFGISSVCIGLALKENEEDGAPHGVLVSIERQEENIAKAVALAERWHVRRYVKFVVNDSVDWLRRSEMAGTEFEIAVFDSTRTKRVEEFDVLRTKGLLKEGALLVFHDTSSRRSDSMPAQHQSQSYYLNELERVRQYCSGSLVFPLSRGMRIFQFRKSGLPRSE